jgi:molecular chaperone DnaK
MMGEFVLAVDIGTSRIGAATARRTASGDLDATTMPLGRARDSAPSTVFVGDTAMLFGDAAERRGLAQPERMLRDVVGRIGDDVPYLAGDRRLMAPEVFAAIVAWVVDTARERLGAAPAGVIVTLPMTWGAYRTELVRSALDRAGLGSTQVTTAPDAVAAEYESATPVRPGHGLAVYDFGGGVFESVVLRKDRASGRLQVAGSPASARDLGGADIDDAVLARVLRSTGLTVQSSEFTDVPALAAAALRRECVEGKEALSFDSETVVPVIVGAGGSVRLTRGELESMIEPIIERTMDVLARAIDSARMNTADLDAILLVGGSSRIPRIAQMISERFDRPVVIDVDPKAIVALGAARALGAAALASAAGHEVAPAPGRMAAPSAVRRRSWLRRSIPGAATGTAAVVLAAGIVVSTGSAVAPAMTAFAVTTGQGILGLEAIEDAIAAGAGSTDPVPPATPAAEIAPPVADWSSPRSSTPGRAPTKPRNAAPDAYRPPVAASPGEDAAAPAAPRVPTRADDPPAAAAEQPLTGDEPASPSEPPVDPNPLDPAPADPEPTDPAPTTPSEPVTPDPAPQPEPEPQPDPQPEPEPIPQPEPQPDSSTTPADPAPPAEGTAG